MSTPSEAVRAAVRQVEESLDGEVGAEAAQLVATRLREFSRGMAIVALYRMWDNRMWLVAQSGYDVVFDGIDPEFGVVGRAVRTGEIQRVRSGELDPDWVGVAGDYTSQLAVPVGDHLVNFEFRGDVLEDDTSEIEGFARRFVRRVRASRSSTIPGGDVARSLVTIVNLGEPELIAEYALRLVARFAGMSAGRVVVVRPDEAPITAAWQTPESAAIPSIDHVAELAKRYRGFSTATVPHDGGMELVVPLSDDRGFHGGIVGTGDPIGLDPDRTAAVAALAAHTVACLHRAALEGRLRESNEARSRFVAALSHELRTPLTAVVGYGEMLVEGVDDPDERKEFAVAIRDSAAHLLALVSDVLDVARSDAGRLVVDQLESLSVRGLTEEVLAVMHPQAVDRRVTLSLDIDPEVRVHGNAKRVRQILFNLVSNAVKYTEDGSVRVTAEQTGPSVMIRIIDEGDGIEPAVMAQLFEPFSGRSAETGRSGTGLGLVISRRLAEAMEGSLHLESKGPNTGTTAVVSLPAAGEADSNQGDG